MIGGGHSGAIAAATMGTHEMERAQSEMERAQSEVERAQSEVERAQSDVLVEMLVGGEERADRSASAAATISASGVEVLMQV